MPYSAIIFDLDGTLIDTETLVIEAGHAALLELGLEDRLHILHDLVGLTAAQSRPVLEAAFSESDLVAFNRGWSLRVTAAFDGPIPQKPGASDLLSHLNTRRTPVAVATNGQSTNARTNLGNAGLGHLIPDAHVFGRDRVANAKPAPDLFLAAAAHVGAAPERVLVFEDSEVGTAAALAAGMTVVQVPDQKPAATRNAHFLAQSLIEGARAAGLLHEE